MKNAQEQQPHRALTNTPPRFQRAITRRLFVRRTAGAAAGLTFGILASPAIAARRNRRLPTPQRSGIEHIVVVMMENRSFDHFLGWLPGAEGRQAGLTYT